MALNLAPFGRWTQQAVKTGSGVRDAAWQALQKQESL